MELLEERGWGVGVGRGGEKGGDSEPFCDICTVSLRSTQIRGQPAEQSLVGGVARGTAWGGVLAAVFAKSLPPVWDQGSEADWWVG